MITHALEVSKNSEAGSARAYSVPSIKLADGWPAPSAKWHLLDMRQRIGRQDIRSSLRSRLHQAAAVSMSGGKLELRLVEPVR